MSRRAVTRRFFHAFSMAGDTPNRPDTRRRGVAGPAAACLPQRSSTARLARRGRPPRQRPRQRLRRVDGTAPARRGGAAAVFVAGTDRVFDTRRWSARPAAAALPRQLRLSLARGVPRPPEPCPRGGPVGAAAIRLFGTIALARLRGETLRRGCFRRRPHGDGLLHAPSA